MFDPLTLRGTFDVLNCPFCGWHRIRDRAKGNALPWDHDSLLWEWVEHVNEHHAAAFNKLMLSVYDHDRMPVTHG